MINNLEIYDKDELIRMVKKYNYTLKVIYEICNNENKCFIQTDDAIKKIKRMSEFLINNNLI
jgi:hypothetical protein